MDEPTTGADTATAVAEPAPTPAKPIVNSGLGLGRIVLYRIGPADLIAMRSTRGHDATIASPRGPATPGVVSARTPTMPAAGDVFPMIITKANKDTGAVNGQVFLDGEDTLWVEGVVDAGTEVVQGAYNFPQI